jgi:hypothetical protein
VASLGVLAQVPYPPMYYLERATGFLPHLAGLVPK